MTKGNCFFESERREQELTLTLFGEIDHHSAVRVRTEMDALLYEERPSRVVMDLSHIEFMDSSGLGLIMGRYALMQRLGGELILRRPHKRLVQIFELAGLQRMVRIEETAEEKEENQ